MDEIKKASFKRKRTLSMYSAQFNDMTIAYTRG
jgi:hypothetical protein